MKPVKHSPRTLRPIQPISVREYYPTVRIKPHMRRTTRGIRGGNEINRNLISQAVVFKHQRDVTLFYCGLALLIIVLFSFYAMFQATESFNQLNNMYSTCKNERDIYYDQLRVVSKQNNELLHEVEQKDAIIADYEQRLSEYESYDSYDSYESYESYE